MENTIKSKGWFYWYRGNGYGPFNNKDEAKKSLIERWRLQENQNYIGLGKIIKGESEVEEKTKKLINLKTLETHSFDRNKYMFQEDYFSKQERLERENKNIFLRIRNWWRGRKERKRRKAEERLRDNLEVLEAITAHKIKNRRSVDKILKEYRKSN